jgi:hypothetical protein
MVRLGKKSLPPGVLAITKDHAGRDITLTAERWSHIVKGHPAMMGLEMAVKRALENADEIGRGNGPNIEIIYGRNLGPARWLAVVVAYEEHNAGFILTAYPQTKDPKASEKGKERPTEAES